MIVDSRQYKLTSFRRHLQGKHLLSPFLHADGQARATRGLHEVVSQICA
jgi:hypothetical protein